MFSQISLKCYDGGKSPPEGRHFYHSVVIGAFQGAQGYCYRKRPPLFERCLFLPPTMNHAFQYHPPFSTSRCRPHQQKIMVRKNITEEDRSMGNKIESIETMSVIHGERKKVCFWWHWYRGQRMEEMMRSSRDAGPMFLRHWFPFHC